MWLKSVDLLKNCLHWGVTSVCDVEMDARLRTPSLQIGTAGKPQLENNASNILILILCKYHSEAKHVSQKS